jgi:hypothetical protein
MKSEVTALKHSHRLYQKITSISLGEGEFSCGPVLARALRSPRPKLVVSLVQKGLFSSSGMATLQSVWEAMRSITFRYEGGVRCFDNIYDLLLWVYVQLPLYEHPDLDNPSKLIFRGHRDSIWSLTTTAHRNLKTDGQREKNQKRIERFIRRVRAEFPQKILETQLEQEAVAQHYGEQAKVSTTLLDFTTDVDVAAYFATKSTAAKYGTIFMCDTSAALGDGRFQFVKIPDRFKRPNAQSGLFFKVPDEEGPICDASNTFIQRLNFRQYGLDSVDTLLSNVGVVEPEDEVAHLAKSKAGTSKRPLSDDLNPIVLMCDPDEARTYGTRLLQYAGLITDDGQVGLLGDLVTNIVNNSVTGVRQFIDWVGATYPRLAYGTREDLTPLIEFLSLATHLVHVYAIVKEDAEYARSFIRKVLPRSVLIVDASGPGLDKRGEVAALRLRQHLGLPPEQREILPVSFAINPETISSLPKALEVIEASGYTLLLRNLEWLVELIGPADTTNILHRVASLPWGVVATANQLAPHDFYLGRFFNCFFSGPTDLMSDEGKVSITKRIKKAVKTPRRRASSPP